jgi:hypothetical protein
MNKTKFLSDCTGGLLAFVGIGAVACGFMLIIEPDGSSIGLPLNLLENSPFENFLIPGIALFTVNGLASLLGALLAFQKNRYAGYASILLGVAMIIWISAEYVWYEGKSFLQPAMFTIGVLEILLGFFLYKQYPENCEMFKKN